MKDKTTNYNNMVGFNSKPNLKLSYYSTNLRPRKKTKMIDDYSLRKISNFTTNRDKMPVADKQAGKQTKKQSWTTEWYYVSWMADFLSEWKT